jgi:hypothetical protein
MYSSIKKDAARHDVGIPRPVLAASALCLEAACRRFPFQAALGGPVIGCQDVCKAGCGRGVRSVVFAVPFVWMHAVTCSSYGLC